jgi:NAD-dependent dihydropyrimidine dehydrogenase PreA subunit
MYIAKFNTLKLEAAKCIGCGLCKIVCPHRVFDMKERQAIMVKREHCIECGACMSNCPTGAIEVKAGVGCAYAIK